MKLNFEISYTIDVLLFIDSMIRGDYDDFGDDMKHFLPMLGTVSDKYLKKLKKKLRKNPQFIEFIVSMILVHNQLHILTAVELLKKPKQIVSQFKKSPYYKTSSPELKKFANSNFERGLSYLTTIAIDLERLGFKSFWLKEKLTLLKMRSREYNDEIERFNPFDRINHWLNENELLYESKWYILSYSSKRFATFFGDFNVISTSVTENDLFEKMLSYLLFAESNTKAIKGILRKTGKNVSLKLEFKSHPDKNHYKNLVNYVEISLKIALKVHLINEIKQDDNVKITRLADYPLSQEIYGYMNEYKKSEVVTIEDYITSMFKHLLSE